MRVFRNRIIMTCLLAAAAFAAACPGAAQTLPEVQRRMPPIVGGFDSGMIDESSGLVKSSVHRDVYWTHNDSGDRPRLFAVTDKGELIQPERAPSYTGILVHGAENADWEDIACDHQGTLYMGDIGNNRRSKEIFTIYRIPEPSPEQNLAVFADKRMLVYYPDENAPSGMRKDVNAEALFWARGNLFIITKEEERPAWLYMLPADGPDVQTPLTLVDSFDFHGSVTGADASPDGKRLAVLTYTGVWLFQAEDDSLDYFGGNISWLPILAGQCEAICLDGDRLLLTNEQGMVFQVPVGDLVSLSGF
jgi:hypothetical protein